MATRYWFSLILVLAAALGCTPSAPPTPPPPTPVPTPAPVVTPEPAPSSETPPLVAPTTPTPESPKPKPTAVLRDLAARLVESDGAGGWRISEKPATELEKLGLGAVADLLPLLADEKVEVRRGAAFYLLGSFEPASRDQVARFSKLIEDQDRPIRGIGLAAVKQMRHEDQLAILPQLTAAAAGDPDPKFRSACLTTIAQATPPEQSLPLLVKALADADSSVRLVAMARLGSLGPVAVPAIKDLAAALEDGNPLIRNGAGTALVKIGAPATDAFAAKLTSTNVETRKVVLAALAKLGPAAKAALPAVEKCRTDADPQVKQLAETAARNIAGQ